MYISERNRNDRCVLIATNAGRLLRPLLILNAATQRVKLRQWYVDYCRAGLLAFGDLVSRGVVEHLDINAQNNAR